ncbi:HAMP domain-containing sensor histidine kinase [Alicyclobacillus acidiphilus]|uniref:HAMP domain-containing sensor histidine kinase n=1 Tax=Alicyclobacillus acidiphilus TaxID=182455 RepID=UPI000835AA18|nr:HAMP domain-containing sensor histidine kinase [Alicyclobacillus acidiphilus]
MRIRKYMVIGVLCIVVFPWFVYFFISMVDGHSWKTQSSVQQANLARTIKMVAQHERNWKNPEWQHGVAAELERQGIDIEILSSTNQVIFESEKHPHPRWMSTQQAMVMNDGKWVGTVLLSSPGNADPTAAIGAIAAAILAIVFVSFQIGRNVIKPLESMSRAALQIAEGDLDFKLASSSTVEIRQVRNAFQVMVNGLREGFAKQQKLEDERRFFIGAIAHDLRTPLFALRGCLDGIEQGIASSPDKMMHYVSVCKEKAIHLERLVSDLFAFTRLEYMEQTLQRESFNLSEVVNATVSSMAHRAQEKEILLDTKMPTGEFFISGDPHLLERAITNLLDNALKYTPNEGKITVELQTEPEKAVLKIWDTGPGFLPDDLTHMFEPMYRGDTSRNLSTGGAGLGLTIARRIFRSHGGDLFADNSPSGGAVLTGWIPQDSTSIE